MKKIILTNEVAIPKGPFSQAVEINDLVYTSGQLPIDAATNYMEVDDIANATTLCLNAIDAIAREVGSNRNDIIKMNLYLRDINEYAIVNDLYANFFKGCEMPVRTAYAVANLPFGVPIEIEAIIAKSTK